MSFDPFNLISPDKLPRKNLALTMLLFAMLYTFFYVFSLHVLPSIFPNDRWIVQAEFCFSIAIALVIPLVLKTNFSLNTAYKFSLIASIVTVLLVFNPIFILNLLFIFIIGAFFGLTQVAFLASFWRNYYSLEERGKISGIIVFFSLPIYFLISTLIAQDIDPIGIIVLVSSLSVVISLLAWRIHKPRYRSDDAGGNYPEKRTVFLYLLPWLIFLIINSTLSRSMSVIIYGLLSIEFNLVLAIIQLIGSFVGALIGGVMADYLGRRTAIATSITLSGISLALSAFVPNDIAQISSSIASGLGWGILLTLYVFVIWGDLANVKNVTSMYAIGLITIYATNGIGYLPLPLDTIPPMTSALVGCSIIFMLNLPIALAPELAYFDVREKKKMKKYMKKIKQVEESMENHKG